MENLLNHLAFYSTSLNDKLSDQIEDETLFQHPIQKVALEILCDIDENGYFDGDIEKIDKLVMYIKSMLNQSDKDFQD